MQTRYSVIYDHSSRDRSYLMAHTSGDMASAEESYYTQTSTSVIYFYGKWPTILQTVFASVADICITVFMCCYFMKNAREPSLEQTKSLLRTLTVYTINRGLLTTYVSSVLSGGVCTEDALRVLQILQAVTFIVYHEGVFYWLSFHFTGSKDESDVVYVNSLLALLNARRRLRRVSQPDSSLNLAQINVTSPV
ncbi:hypothetical protein WOLCODRAFT_143346 [Wolfiporia cocos MD-104 SS10]|uniref:DUF6534 domain-containing protein n=1 Tax=Wolfiporia cocos (strain MD-104) TaxID=742152 RepID=A0A2H3JFP4_WOLCO|nr:hypothetical protein WOLCODRAFT_143346 [Wolfiporia cocos MD-104 SS10]